MIKNFREVLLSFLVLSAEFAFSQNDKVPYVPPSPNAASLMEYASIPINLSTGTAQVSVPLCELKGKELSIPISLSYHASGIKVQDVSSSVGLGWVLNSGGVVTRVVRGIADESADGYLNSDFDENMNDANNLTKTEDIDLEPDLFFYNINGKTGRIVFSEDQQPIQIPENDLKIVAPNFGSTNPMWEITDTNGVKFVFGKTSGERETTTSSLNKPIKYKTYISSWYLSEIIYPFGNDKITLSYQTGSNVYFENYRQYLESNLNIITQCVPPIGWGYSIPLTDIITKITINSPKYVSLITSSLGSVSMSYANDRQDLPNGLRLQQLIYKNSSNAELRKFNFINNQYFLSDDCVTSDCKRLKLEKINEVTNGTSIPYRTFGYSLVNLPSRKSVKYDHWGYYNNNTYSSAIPISRSYNGYNGPITFGGADKSPNLDRTMANALLKVTNYLGGSQELQYQLNDYDDNGTLKNTGGLRIYKMIEDDGTEVSPSIVKVYKYNKTTDPTKSSGIIYRKNVYDYLFSKKQYCATGGIAISYAHVISYSTSLLDLFDIGGSNVNYSDVQIEYNHGGKEHLFFTNFNERPDDPITFLAYSEQDAPPFISKGDRSYERGMLTEHIYYNANGKKVKRVLNTYDFYLASTLQARGGRVMLMAVEGNNYYGRRGVYTHTHRGVRLLTTLEEDYDQVDDTRKAVRTTSYEYNGIYKNLVNRKSVSQSDGTMAATYYKYPLDCYSTTPVTSSDIRAEGLYQMIQKYMVGIPIETLNQIKPVGTSDYKTIGGVLTTYKKNSLTGNPVLYENFRLKTSEPISFFTTSFVYSNTLVVNGGYKLTRKFGDYDSNDKPLSEINQSGQELRYTWTSPESLIESINVTSGGYEHKKSYSHLPLIGLQKIVDENGIKTTFEYDKLNRLKLIRDNDLNIGKRILYHYRSEQGIDVSFEYSGNRVIGNTLTFQSTVDTESLGTNNYVWDFGDGNILETTSNSVTHTYSAVGNFVAKLSKINSLYGSKLIEKNLAIVNALTGQITKQPTPGPCLNSYSVTANVAGGCGSLTYYWFSNGNTSYGLGTDPTIEYSAPLGTNTISCIITDSCGNQLEISTTIVGTSDEFPCAQ